MSLPLVHSRRRRERFPTQDTSFWMITFSDLLTLMLTFFVLRVAMGTIQQERFDKAFDIAQSGESAPPSTYIYDSMTEALLDGAPVDEDRPSDQFIDGEQLQVEQFVQIEPTDNGALLLLAEGSFDSASDRLSLEAYVAIHRISQVVKDTDFTIDIAGHTDSIPIRSERFESNWELSTARAIAVARELISGGVRPEQISVIGYADTKPRAHNDTLEGRALNRRVELLVSK